jgi:hypothetical protein
MEKTEDVIENQQVDAGRVWEDWKYFCVSKRDVRTGKIKTPSIAHALYGNIADVLETLYRATYRGGYGHPEQRTAIRTKVVAEKAGVKFRRQREILNLFQADGVLTWSLIPAGRRDPTKKRFKVWGTEEGIEYTLRLSPLVNRVEEAKAKDAERKAANMLKTEAARKAIADRVRRHRENASISEETVEVTPMSLAGTFHRLMESYEQRKRSAVGIATPSGGQVSFSTKLTPELTSMLLGKKKGSSRQANAVKSSEKGHDVA